MRAVALAADDLVKSLGRPWLRVGADRDWRALALLVVAAGPVYGACMGSFALHSPERLLMLVYAAAKVPMLILATTAVCLPGFYALSSVLGLRSDFGRAMRAILAGQAAMTVALAALGPVTLLAYAGGLDHGWSKLFNAGMFTVATGFAQAVMLRRYRGLIASNRAHRVMLWTWVVMYAFVGIQMAWMLRPFVGAPDLPVTFFRQEPFTNAYVHILHLVVGILRG